MDPAPEARSPSPTDPAARAATMVRRARAPLLIAMALVAGVVVVVPLWLELPSLSVLGLILMLALGLAVRAIDGTPDRFRLAAHGLYALALGAVGYAVFELGLPAVITVYFPALVLLGAAHILGARAALFWSLPSVALVAAGVYLAPAAPRSVDEDVTFLVRGATLLTILAFAISFRRAHDRQAAELQQRAATDPLTGLANRRALDRALTEALERSARFGRRGALLFIDLDGVKAINDRLGHAAGDELLRTAARRIAGHTRAIDTPARLGGDEFVVLVSEFDDPKGGEVVARKLLRTLREACDLYGEAIVPSASLGMAIFPEDSREPIELMRLADDAMYAAKRAGGGRIFVHAPGGPREVEAG